MMSGCRQRDTGSGLGGQGPPIQGCATRRKMGLEVRETIGCDGTRMEILDDSAAARTSPAIWPPEPLLAFPRC